MREKYERFRAYLLEEFNVNGRKLPLDLSCGAMRVESFDIDSQTIYARLNAAYEESKTLRGGDMVEKQVDA